MLPGLVLTEPDADLIRLDDDRLLLSGAADELVLYDLAEGRAVMLPVKVPSIRGRAFRATVTGGMALADGTVVAGTADGMLFTLSADLRKTASYGRLYSSGHLRCFVRRNGEEVFGVYGGARDAGHVFHFSREHGFTDLGRPRVIKDNAELRELDSEWASIHSISCLAYSPEDDSLCVGSGELYGCVVRYSNVAVPGQGGESG